MDLSEGMSTWFKHALTPIDHLLFHQKDQYASRELGEFWLDLLISCKINILEYLQAEEDAHQDRSIIAATDLK